MRKGDHGGKSVWHPIVVSETDGVWRVTVDEAIRLGCPYAQEVARRNTVWLARSGGSVLGCKARKRDAWRLYQSEQWRLMSGR